METEAFIGRKAASAQEEQNMDKELIELGKLSATLLHEVANPLTNIRSQVHLLQAQLERGLLNDDVLNKQLQQLDSNMDRVIQFYRTVRQAITKKGKLVKGLCQVKEIWSSALGLVQTEIDHFSIDVMADTVSLKRMINCDEEQMVQVMFNLLNNACSVVKNLDERWIRLESSRHKDYIELRLRNSGPAIASHVQEQIFQPFYSDKSEAGKGMGIGLYYCRDCVEQHGGQIFVNATAPHPEFVIQLPANS